MSLQTKSGLTKRAPDVWDSAAFSSIFHASSFSCSQALFTPAHTQVTQAVGAPLQNIETLGQTHLDFENAYFFDEIVSMFKNSDFFGIQNLPRE